MGTGLGKLETFGDVTRTAPPAWRGRSLVVFEPTGFFRRLTLDVLRFAGAEKLVPTACPDDALATVSETRHSVLVAGWHEGADGPALVRRLRTTPGPAQRAEAILISAPRRMLDIEDARDAGASGLLLRPFSADAVETRLREVTTQPARFIRTTRFTGPDRRKLRPKHLSQPPGHKRGADIEAGLVTPMEAALNQADDMAFQSMRRGDPVGARVGRSLRRFLERLDTLDADAQEVIGLHRATLARLEELRGAEAQVRAELVNGLESIVDRRKAA